MENKPFIFQYGSAIFIYIVVYCICINIREPSMKLTVLDSVLNVGQQAYLPDPKGLWPFSKHSLSQETNLFLDSSKTKIPSDNGAASKNQVGFETLHTPVGLYGSTLFTQDASSIKSQVILDYRGQVSGWMGISLLFWIKIENPVFDQKYTIMVCIKKLFIMTIYYGIKSYNI